MAGEQIPVFRQGQIEHQGLPPCAPADFRMLRHPEPRPGAGPTGDFVDVMVVGARPAAKALQKGGDKTIAGRGDIDFFLKFANQGFFDAFAGLDMAAEQVLRHSDRTADPATEAKAGPCRRPTPDQRCNGSIQA